MTIWRSVMVWLGAILYGIPWVHASNAEAWQGATAEWSPQASVAAVESVAAWDVTGWADKSQRQTHKRLDGLERRIDTRLDALLAAVYEWRDAEGSIPWKACWRPGSLGLSPLRERVTV